MVTNKNCINRLSKYKNALARLKSLGFVKVFSDNLADAIGVTAAQVRKDFSLFGLSGSKRGGYNVDELIKSLNEILGKNKVQKVIIAGAGNIGTALMNYPGFEKEGIQIVAAFDISQDRQIEAKIPVCPLEEMKDFIRKNKIKIGIIAVPDMAAQSVLDLMTASGIEGILNFAPIRLNCSGDCIVNNVNFVFELENLIYHVSGLDKKKGQ